MLPGNVLLIPAAVDAADPFTRLLLHMDGTDGATTFPDSSPSARTVTVNGNAQVDTAQSVFGGASALFDGTGDFLTVPEAADFDIATGDFVIDFRWRTSSLGGFQLQEILSKRANSGVFAPIEISCQPVGDSLQVYASSNGYHGTFSAPRGMQRSLSTPGTTSRLFAPVTAFMPPRTGPLPCSPLGWNARSTIARAWNIGGVSGADPDSSVGWMSFASASARTGAGLPTSRHPQAHTPAEGHGHAHSFRHPPTLAR